MHGMLKSTKRAETVVATTITPEMATKLLEANKINRPLNDSHVKWIAAQIKSGKWRFNGDTIKVSVDGDVLDGQHRLWAVMDSQTAVDTIVVYGVVKEAFATIDTGRKPRSGADILAIKGVVLNRKIVSAALTWLVRWQRKTIASYKENLNRVDNADIEAAFEAHPNITYAVEQAAKVKRVGNQGIIAFLYYVLSNHKPELALRLLETLKDPSGVAANDPFFLLRKYFLGDREERKSPVMTIALAIKAINLAASGKKVPALVWRPGKDHPKDFPVLSI